MSYKMLKPKQAVKISNWLIANCNQNEYAAPEDVFPCLIGDTVDHPETGIHKVRTSKLIFLNPNVGLAETENTFYILCEPDQEWLGWLEKHNFKITDYKFNNE